MTKLNIQLDPLAFNEHACKSFYRLIKLAATGATGGIGYPPDDKPYLIR